MKSLKEKVRDLEKRKRKAKDFDPEDDVVASASEEESENNEELKDDAGREHYEAVGKSKLRKPVQPTLDAKYGGVAVSRSALNASDDEHDPFAPVDESDEEDPFAARNGATTGSVDEEEQGSDAPDDLAHTLDGDESEEIDSDEALGESDAEKFKDFKFRGSKKNRIQPAEDDDMADQDSEEDEDEDESEDATGDSDIDMDDSEDESTDNGDDDDGSSVSSATRSSPPALRASKSSQNPDREELKRLAFSSASTAGLASALSAGANADVKKGQAVKQQRQTFDRLIDARIKLQKGVTAANELGSSSVGLTDEEVQSAAKQAEEAALALWSTIDSIRCTLLSGSNDTETSKSTSNSTPNSDSKSSSLKRKHPHQPLKPTRSTTLSEIWDHSTQLEEAARQTRRQILDKWHAKTQPVLDTAPRSKLLPSKSPHNSTTRLTDVLDTYLATESGKLISQSWTGKPTTNTANTTSTTNNGSRVGDNKPAQISTSSSTSTLVTEIGTGIYDDNLFYQSLLRELIASRTAAANATTGNTNTTSILDGPLLPPKLHPSGSRHKQVDTKASKGRKVRYTVHEKLENFMAPEERATWEDAARTEFFASLFGNNVSRVLDERDGDGDEDEQGQGETNGEAEALRLFRN